MSLRLDQGVSLPEEWRQEAAEMRSRLHDGVARLADAPPGFLEILAEGDDVSTRCRRAAARLAGASTVVVLGIGGSALGARTIRDALAPERAERLRILDNVDPDTIARTTAELVPARTAFLVVSKSGSTAETAAQLVHFRDWLLAAGVDPVERMTLITDPERGPLREMARRDGFETLDIPPRVGGRFSVMSPVGLLPAALLDIDPGALLEGGRRLWNAVRQQGERGETHPLLDWVVSHVLRAERGGQRIQVLMSYADRLRTFGGWFAQLWGESLGKRLDRAGEAVHRGSTPLPAVGATDQHSLVQLFAEGPDDKQYLVLGIDRETTPRVPLAAAGAIHPEFGYLADQSIDALFEAERIGTTEALMAAGRPVSRLQLARLDAETLGALFVLFELATVLTAELTDVNPYDQPGVETGKWIAFARMGREGYRERVESTLGPPRNPPPGLPLL